MPSPVDGRPGGGRARLTRSPRRDIRGGGRRGGERRGGRDGAGTARPRKTQEDLDREMDDYWGPSSGQGSTGGAVVASGLQNGIVEGNMAPVVVGDDGDVDMGVE